MKPFCEIVEDLKPDGALRDFYISKFNIRLWQLFLDSVRPLAGPQDFRIDGKIAPLPSAVTDIFAIRRLSSPCLSIPVGSATIRCHFFTEIELELDFHAADYATEDNWTELCRFLTQLCTTLDRNGIICYESVQNLVIETFYAE